MKLAKLKWGALELVGYVFCEASFRWWDIFDDGSDIENRIYYPTFWEQLVYLIGVPSYKIGCFFYGLQDDSVWEMNNKEYRHLKEDCVAYQEGGMGCPDCYCDPSCKDDSCHICGGNTPERVEEQIERLEKIAK